MTALSTTSQVQDALGQSEAFLAFQDRLSLVAPVERPVLILGERGTGKELAATRLHFLSKRWQGPLVTLNCAALAPTLVETELFGHEKGAFTGARQQRTGRFERAHGGTLFLDEIGSVPAEVQEKILRVVEYGVFERVGGAAPIEANVRIVSATNADLPAMAKTGLFKPDLLDRLSFEVLFVPPLRHRKEDIPLLAGHFAARMAYEMGRDEPPDFSAKAIDRLAAHAWPGNVRELKNVVERAVYRCRKTVVDEIVFNPFVSPYEPAAEAPQSASKHGVGETDTALPDAHPEKSQDDPFHFIETVMDTGGSLPGARAKLEFAMVKKALENNQYNRKKAAEDLGVTYDQLRGLYRKYEDQLT